jgi:hypothetical protein
MAWPTFTAGAVLTAAQMTELAKHGNVWTSYTPTLTAATTNPTGISYTGSGYIQAGKLVIFRAVISMSATPGTGAYSIALPVTGKATVTVCDGLIIDGGVGNIAMTAILGTTAASLFVDPTTAGGYLRAMTQAVPFAIGSGDTIIVTGTYEAA